MCGLGCRPRIPLWGGLSSRAPLTALGFREGSLMMGTGSGAPRIDPTIGALCPVPLALFAPLRSSLDGRSNNIPFQMDQVVQ